MISGTPVPWFVALELSHANSNRIFTSELTSANVLYHSDSYGRNEGHDIPKHVESGSSYIALLLSGM